MTMMPLVLTRFSAVNGMGDGVAATRAALRAGRSALTPCHFQDVALATYAAHVSGLETYPLPPALAEFDTRNNRLALACLRQDGFEQRVARARERYGARRIALVLGTSTSGILTTELAYRRRDPHSGALPADCRPNTTHNLYATTEFTRRFLDLHGPALTVSTACSSSAKVFASAWRLISQGWCDAAVVGGVDSLCLSTLYGFASLDLLASEPCRPCDAERAGISIGEAAGFALLERPEYARDHSGVALLGIGESSDAHHMSTPHPQGLGALLSMQRALASAGLAPQDIDYINLHGTATQANDAMEDQAVYGVFGNATPCSSTKGWTGHALGAAGITEAIISAVCLQEGYLPASLNTRTLDPSFRSAVLLAPRAGEVRRVLSNSFGFGGSNCSLIFGRHP